MKQWKVSTLVKRYGQGKHDYETLQDADEVMKHFLCKLDGEDEGEFYWNLLCEFEAKEIKEAVRDIAIGLFIGMNDAGDYSKESKTIQAEALVYAALSLLTCNNWLKSGLDDKDQLPPPSKEN